MKQKTPLGENRKLAKAVAAVCVAFSILVMGPVKLGSLRNEGAEAFRKGSYQEYTLSVYTDIRSAAENAGKLAAMALSRLGEDDADARTLKTLCADALAMSDETEMLGAFYRIVPLSDGLYARLLAQNLNSDELADAKRLNANVQSAYNTIGKDGYFALADSFNRARGGFPARLLAGLTGIDELPTGGNQ